MLAWKERKRDNHGHEPRIEYFEASINFALQNNTSTRISSRIRENQRIRKSELLILIPYFSRPIIVSHPTHPPSPQRACEQWFCRLDALAEQARRALTQVTLVPAQGAAQV